MFSKAQQQLLVLGLLVGLSASLDCSKRPKAAHPLACCDIPDLISDEIDEKCEPLLTTTRSPTTDPQDSEAVNEIPLHAKPCFISCALNVTGIFVDNTLNEDNVRQYLDSHMRNKVELQNVTRVAFNNCVLKLPKKKNTQTRLNLAKCSPRPNILLRCVYRTIFMSCPKYLWTESKDCDDLHKYFEVCG